MTPALYRKWIREVIAGAAPYGLPDAAMEDAVQNLAGGRFDLSDYRGAVEWNLSKDYIRASDNEDTDQREWKLTKLGTAKQSSDE